MPKIESQFVRHPEFASQVLAATATLSDEVSKLRFVDPVHLVYNPLQYAWSLHSQYVQKWGASTRRVLMFGMNPGPWGMAQTGVPFGEIAAVKEFLDLSGDVGKPQEEHPKRPIQGLDCPRSEVSGRRLWGMVADYFGSPEQFFAEHFVVNYCPLVFMEDSARNRTPDKLPVAEQAKLFAACDKRLIELVRLYDPQWVVGVGGFARKKLDGLFKKADNNLRIGTVLHPSPASPAANRGWSEAAVKQMTDQEIWEGGIIS